MSEYPVPIKRPVGRPRIHPVVPSPTTTASPPDEPDLYLPDDEKFDKELIVGVKKLVPSAIIPEYQSAGAACFDLHAIHSTIINPSQQCIVRTGLAFDIPEGWVLKVYSRSGHGFKHGIRLANATGVIDCDYIGELMICLRNDSGNQFHVWEGDRIAQAMLERAQRVTFKEVQELKDTERGAGGMGSTGA